MTIQVATYKLHSGTGDEWLGYVILPSGQQLLVRFSGSSEQAVIEKAQAFYEKEKARQDRLYGSTAAAADNDAVSDDDDAPSGRGFQFVGKIWMLNRETGERARVLPAEVADYVARGFQRGGPRSK